MNSSVKATTLSNNPDMRIYFIRLTGGGMEQKKQRRDEELLQKIILRVKELRRLHDHQSQEELAEATGLGIAQLESGKNFPNLTTITIICKFYNITLDEFFAPLNYPLKDK